MLPLASLHICRQKDTRDLRKLKIGSPNHISLLHIKTIQQVRQHHALI